MSDPKTMSAISQLLDESDSVERLDHLAQNIAKEIDEFTDYEREGLRTIYRARKEELKGQSEFCTSLAKWLARDAFADDPASWTQGKRQPKKPDKAADRSRVLYQKFRELQTALAELAVDSEAWTETRAEMDRLAMELDKVTA